MTSYIRKQLLEVALPAAPRGLNIKVTFKGVLADQEARQKWLSRFTYWFVSAIFVLLRADVAVHAQLGLAEIVLC